LPVLTFSPLPVIDRLRLGAVAAAMKALPNADPLEGKTASQWLSHWMGERAYELAFAPLFRGKFGEYADQIAMPWFWARIHCRTSAPGSLLGGFRQRYEKLVAGIEPHGGKVCLGTEISSVRPDEANGYPVAIAAGEERYNRVVSTLPPRVTFKVVPD